MDNLDELMRIQKIEDIGIKNTMKYELADGSKYLIYIPDNLNADTKILVNIPGSGKAEAYNVAVPEEIAASNCNSIVIIPRITAGDGSKRDIAAQYEDKIMHIVDGVRDEYGIENKDLNAAGHSEGGFYAFKTVIENVKRNPDIERQTVLLLDDSSPLSVNNDNDSKGMENEGIMTRDYVLYANGGAEAIRKNKTVFFSLQSATKTPMFDDREATALAIAKAGGSYVRVSITKIGDHNEVMKRAFDSEEYSKYDYNYDWQGYLDGETKLPKENHQYDLAVYNYDGVNESVYWLRLDYEDIKTQDKLYKTLDKFYNEIYSNELKSLKYITAEPSVNLLSNVKSDYELVKSSVNGLIFAIQSSNIVKNGGGVISFSGSTTNVPTAILSVVQEYISVSSGLLGRICQDLNSITQIAFSFKVMDQNMKKSAEELGYFLVEGDPKANVSKFEYENKTGKY